MSEANGVLFNLILALSIIAWGTAQVLKGLIYFARHRKINWRVIIGGGGMPSSHSAFVCACATTVARLYGLNSGLFAISFVLAFIVMYDASHVRRAAGEQAKILNYILDHWNEMPPELRAKELKELLGHTNLQVIFGAIWGILIGLVGSELAIWYVTQ